MGFLYLLAGENLELARREIEGFLGSQGIREEPESGKRLAFTDSEPGQLKRLALTHEVSRVLDQASSPEELDIDAPDGSFAVRTWSKDKDIKGVESMIGEKLSNEDNRVDLERPETVIKVYHDGERYYAGEMIQDIERGLFGKRANHERPFSSPVSMDPVLARTLVNLSEAKPGERLLDPFCGTGGILIEAGLCGVAVSGRDADQEMLEGTRENLEEYGIIGHDISRKSISEFDDFNNFDAVVTDLPYGKASPEEGEAVEQFLEIAEKGPRTVFMYNEPSLKDLEPEFELYVHSNLTRYIYLID